MSDMNRRDAVKLLAMAPLAGLSLLPSEIERVAALSSEAVDALAARGETYTPKFFTPHEWKTVRVLVDLILPRDERSGSATDARVPEFMDFIMIEYPSKQMAMRDGLGWLEAESQRRCAKSFAECTAAERTTVLDDIAWPLKVKAELKAGVEFFNGFRDLTASGFWSSSMGVRDLRYIGNTALARWNGCPPAALRKLGVSYGV